MALLNANNFITFMFLSHNPWGLVHYRHQQFKTFGAK